MPQLLHASNDPGDCLRHLMCYCCRPSAPLQVLLSKYSNGVILACITNINFLAFDPAFKAWYNYMKTLASNTWLLTPCPPALLRHDDSFISGIPQDCKSQEGTLTFIKRATQAWQLTYILGWTFVGCCCHAPLGRNLLACITARSQSSHSAPVKFNVPATRRCILA